jgi:hypothetical protein
MYSQWRLTNSMDLGCLKYQTMTNISIVSSNLEKSIQKKL